MASRSGLRLVRVVAAVVGAATLVAMGPILPAGGVIGGQQTAPGTFGWTVSLDNGCTAALIAPTWALTAAHCDYQGSMVARVGFYDDSRPGVAVPVISRHVNPGFSPPPDPTFAANDVMLLQLAFAVDAPIVPLARPDQAAAWTPGSKAPFAGFGVSCGPAAYGDPPCTGPDGVVMYDAVMTVISIEDCRAAYPDDPGFAPSGQVCTGVPEGGVSPCPGDSGGSLLASTPDGLVAFAVVSGGMDPCGSPGGPAVYTELVPLLDWIAAVSGVAPPPPPSLPHASAAPTTPAVSATPTFTG